MLKPDVHALIYSSREFLNVLYLLGILIIDLLDDFERSMRFAEDFIDLFSRGTGFLFNFHAIISPFSTFNMKVYLTVLLCTLNDCPYIWTFFTANDTSNVEFTVIKLVHLDWSPRSNLRPRHPQRTAVVHPMV